MNLLREIVERRSIQEPDLGEVERRVVADQVMSGTESVMLGLG